MVFVPVTVASIYDKNKVAFITYFKKMLESSDKYNKKSTMYRRLAEQSLNSRSKNRLTKMRNQFYYDNVRIVTEIYYGFVEWFDRVFVINGIVPNISIQNLINQIYNKGFGFIEELNDKPENPTEEEQHIINVFLNQVKETSALLEPYVTVKQPIVKESKPVKSTRKRLPVDYTGMDTVEPLNEYDGITNIWADTTKYTDPDYVYESDEDESEDEDEKLQARAKARAYYAKGKDYAKERAYVKAKKAKAEAKAEAETNDYIIQRVNKRHTRFVYNK